MNAENLSAFSCRHCIAGYRRGEAPIWLLEYDGSQRRATGQGPLCFKFQDTGLCAKAMLRRLVEDEQLTIDVTVEG